MTSDDPAERPAPPRRRLGLGAAVVAVLVVLAVTVGIGVLRGATTPVEAVTVDIGSAGPSNPGLQVHVAGAVAAPGLYVLRADARVVDAVAAAGGFLDGAARDAVNLARPLSDGEQLLVPAAGESPSAGPPAVADGRVNLNTADAAVLDTLPRIGPALAQRIIDWRDENGRFTSVEDLLAVPGIGDKMLDFLRELVTI
ncbi:ComEA family DNA-binding protein [Microbacterium aoyamense]|uniref:ComEA family DNA-binding protein n=1 Tax=Microbacterium aoyamense TaxID=344166 RepID=UPI00200504E0|nr:ComEA family DNA-binding protein [Microbacterium aoyamense]